MTPKRKHCIRRKPVKRISGVLEFMGLPTLLPTHSQFPGERAAHKFKSQILCSTGLYSHHLPFPEARIIIISLISPETSWFALKDDFSSQSLLYILLKDPNQTQKKIFVK